LKYFLSIDLDYAFSPTISQYDDYIEGSRISLTQQKKILKENNLPEPTINIDKFMLLVKILKMNSEHVENINTGDHHNQIINFLPNDSFSLYNFDHHHDIYYPGWHDLKVLDEGNWVSHLENFNIKEYIWIRNKDSENIYDFCHLAFPVISHTSVDFKSLPRFEDVFICKSPHWTGDESEKFLDALQSSNDVLRDERLKGSIGYLKNMAMSGDPNDLNNAKEALRSMGYTVYRDKIFKTPEKKISLAEYIQTNEKIQNNPNFKGNDLKTLVNMIDEKDSSTKEYVKMILKSMGHVIPSNVV